MEEPISKPKEPSPSFRVYPGRGLIVLVSVACLIIIVAGLRLASEFFIPIVLGFFLAVLSFPIQRWLNTRGVPEPIAVVLTIFLYLLILSGLIYLASGVIPEFQSKRDTYAALVQQKMTSLTIWIDGTMDSLGNFADRFSPGDPSVATTPPLETKRELLSFREIFDRFWDSSIILDFLGQSALVGKVTSLLTKAFFVFVVMIFVLAESGRYADKVRAVLEAKGPDLGRFHRSAADLQKYLGIKTAVSAATGLLAWLSCSLIGVDFPILWGLIAFVFNYIPAIGSVVAAVPPVILALVQLDGLWGGVVLAICYLAINQTIGTILEPMLLGNRFGISTVVVIVSVVFWGYVWGPVGMFLAVPLTMVVKVMLDNSADWRWISVLMGKGEKATNAPPLVPKAVAGVSNPEASASDGKIS